MIASHYADPVVCRLTAAAQLRDSPKADAAAIDNLESGASFEMLDCKLGWAWGYGGPDRRVGYVESSKIGR